jgi:hypothetical protein
MMEARILKLKQEDDKARKRIADSKRERSLVAKVSRDKEAAEAKRLKYLIQCQDDEEYKRAEFLNRRITHQSVAKSVQMKNF